MKKISNLLIVFLLLLISVNSFSQKDSTKTNPPIYIAFHWHMHQPIYFPYQTVMQTQSSGVYSYNLYDIFNQRTGPYTSWPKDAVQKGINANLGHLGAQVSLSGSLVENLNNLETSGHGFSNWKSSWNYITSKKTVLNNPRIDLVGFGYHHPLMGLIDYNDIRKQIQAHKSIFATNFPSFTYSKGIFPPENAFSERMIPALVDEDLQWVMVDNFNFERASVGCPVGDGTGVLRPNKADIINENPNDWKSLNGLWAPSAVSIQWAHQPHYVQYVNPTSGAVSKIVAVPTSRYLGNEDGRGGFGALNYENVMSQMESYNTDSNHPMLIVLHHDGDNYGGGSEGYYGGNFQNFVNWLQANPSRFVCTTVQDYLDMFPPETSDIIHVQDGSWVGADSGDPEFKKWNGDPGNYLGTPNYSPDRNSWSVVTAAKNIVQTAEQINPSSSYTTQAWKYYLNSQTSCYWYWDGTEMWDSHPARACNLAVAQALNIVNTGNDLTPPTIYVPQREPYNPGDIEWGTTVMPSDFTVWTYVFDYKGLTSVKLKYRIDADGNNDLLTVVNETYTGGTGVGIWNDLTMTATVQASITNPLPTYKADKYSAEITDMENVLIDYYVEAIDVNGNIAKSPIQHVWVGDGTTTPIGSEVSWLPELPNLNEYITITCTNATATTKLHWGVNDINKVWQTPNNAYWIANTQLFGTGPAVETPFTDTDNDGIFTVVLGPFNNAAQIVNRIAFVIHYGDNTWNNNYNSDFHITVNNTPGEEPTGANETVSTSINVNYNFTENDFYFSGITGASFAGIKLISEETVGDLEYSGIDVVVNSDYEDITNLVFKPALGSSGSPYASFTFKVKDSNGLYSSNNYIMTINVISENPVGANSSVTILLDNSYNFLESNFTFSGFSGATFAGIKIISVETAGSLLYQGDNVTAFTDYLDVSLLEFTPDAGQYGMPYASFEFKVIDSEGRYSENIYTFLINVLQNVTTDGVSWYPENPTKDDIITVFVNNDATLNSVGGKLYWGVNNWASPNNVYKPIGTTNTSGAAVKTPFQQNGNLRYINLGPFNNPIQNVEMVDFVISYDNNTWNNNNNQDWHIPISVTANSISTISENSISIYPNPFTDFTFIEITDTDNSEYQVLLLDLTGKIIKQETFESNGKYVLYKNNLPQGVYLLQFMNLKTSIIKTEKIFVY